MFETKRHLALVLFLSLPVVAATVRPTSPATSADPTPPQDRPRVLITNDNGIDDPKLVALARAFAPHAETWVVAPAEDRSGSGTYARLPLEGSIGVEARELGDGIEAFAVDGYPADCVLIALAGMLIDRPPTLVVSGINGGPNLGADWMFSGTIGAARVAALAGFPAIAVSGLDDDIPGAVEAAVDWVVRFTQHEAVRSLVPGEYLTVSLPRLAPEDIRDVRIADRAPLRRGPLLAYDAETDRWKITGQTRLEVPIASTSDEHLHAEGSVVVVPMRADEVDGPRLLHWMRSDPALPGWSPDSASR